MGERPGWRKGSRTTEVSAGLLGGLRLVHLRRVSQGLHDAVGRTPRAKSLLFAVLRSVLCRSTDGPYYRRS